MHAQLQRGDEFVHLERFGDVIVRAEGHALAYALGVGLAGDEQEGNARRGGMLAQQGGHHVAVHLAHDDVADDDIGQVGARELQAGQAVLRFDDLMPARAQQVRH